MSKILLVLCLFITNCCISTQQFVISEYAELSITINNTDRISVQGQDVTEIPKCDECSMDYALITLELLDDEGNVTTTCYYKSLIYETKERIFVQPVKVFLNVQSHARISSFIVYHEESTIEQCDKIINVAPAKGSRYAALLVNSIDRVIELRKLSKVEIIIDVLCFDPLYTANFGYDWIELSDNHKLNNGESIEPIESKALLCNH